MADKKGQTIVIKKITVVAGGGHGGSWKVALADFMTGMMAFFMVMWLLGQSEESKKAVSDYFSTPSVIEYSFSNFGVEITLEKLFLDLVNEPLKAIQSFIEPADTTPNTLDMGSAKVITAFIADQMGDFAKNLSISQDGYEFQIPDYNLYLRGTSTPHQKYITVMEKLKAITTGLEDSEVSITSEMFVQSIPDGDEAMAKRVASERLAMIQKSVESSFENNSNSTNGKINVKEKKGEIDPQKLVGFIRVSIKQKDIKSNGKKPRKIEALFGDAKADMSVYDNFVHQISNKKKTDEKKKTKTKTKVDDKLTDEVKQELHDTNTIQTPTEDSVSD